ncbi:MAG: chemotaxis protein CheW [Gammaproteobacteria bacterium]|nr:chemotaxis protein CheW [Gammaproteobacteria bacterium]
MKDQFMKKTIRINKPVDRCWYERGVWSAVSDKCEKLEEYIHCRNCPVFSSEGKRVLDRAAPAGYLKEWRKGLAANKPIIKKDSRSILVFRVVEEWFAIPSRCLHEITEKKTIHKIPGNNNPGIVGVVNVGGEIRVCYSLESVLGVRCQDSKNRKGGSSEITRFIVAFIGGNYYVFVVQHISGMALYHDDELYPIPSTLAYDGANLLLGVINHATNKVAVLDVDKFQSTLEGILL